MNNIKFSLLTVFMCFSFSNLHATSVLPVDLTDLVDTSAIIISGVCIDNRTEIDNATNMRVTYTTFEIKETIKGNVTNTHTIKQLAGIGNGIPRFNTNAEYIVFLPPASQLGFSSPVGLAQGAFRVFWENDHKLISNGRNIARILGSPTTAASRVKKQSNNHLHNNKMTYDNFVLKIMDLKN